MPRFEGNAAKAAAFGCLPIHFAQKNKHEATEHEDGHGPGEARNKKHDGCREDFQSDQQPKQHVQVQLHVLCGLQDDAGQIGWGALVQLEQGARQHPKGHRDSGQGKSNSISDRRVRFWHLLCSMPQGQINSQVMKFNVYSDHHIAEL